VKINKERVISELSLIEFGSKGWMNSSQTQCPTCGKYDKFGILFTYRGGTTHCFYNCGQNLSLYSYLLKIGREDLVEKERQLSVSQKLPTIEKEEIEEEELPEVKLPKGYERIYFDKYLKDRSFKSFQYDEFEVGITDHFLEKKLKNYLIFVLKQQGKIVGWLARSKRSKEWHKQNLEAYKEGKERLVLRYINSTGTDFERILGGFDQITDNTEIIIAVEGLFDYSNASQLLDTNKTEELKVVFTFGNKFSDSQIKMLRKTNVKRVILLYDPLTNTQSKKYAMELSKYFEVEVCSIDDPDTDPGNITLEYLTEVLSNRKNYIDFYTSKINEVKILN
jgi:hypothetical protein